MSFRQKVRGAHRAARELGLISFVVGVGDDDRTESKQVDLLLQRKYFEDEAVIGINGVRHTFRWPEDSVLVIHLSDPSAGLGVPMDTGTALQ